MLPTRIKQQMLAKVQEKGIFIPLGVIQINAATMEVIIRFPQKKNKYIKIYMFTNYVTTRYISKEN